MRLFLLINPTYQMPFQLYQMAFNALKKKNRGLCSAKNGLGLEKKLFISQVTKLSTTE